MSWEFAPTFDAAHRAALESGKPLVYVCPPAGWAVVPLAERLAPADPDGLAILVLVPEPTDASDVGGTLAAIDALRPVHTVTGHARARRLVGAGAVRTLVLTPPDALALARHSALPLSRIRQVVVAWPEAMLALDQGNAIDAILAESPEAQRLIVTSDERRPEVADLLTRIAHRAPVVAASRLPEGSPAIPIRWIGTDDARRAQVTRTALDVLNPAEAVVWEPVAGRVSRWASIAEDPSVRVLSDLPEQAVPLLVLGDLPSADALAAASSVARELVVLVRASQVAYLERLSSGARVLRVTGEADAALDRAAAVRRSLRERLAEGGLDGELLTLGALFDEYDPTLVAAAALALTATPAPAAPEAASPGWARLQVTAGRRDNVRPGDFVGALVNEMGLARNAIGRIDVRDAFTLIEIRADEAERVQRGLARVSLRGKRVTARPERR